MSDLGGLVVCRPTISPKSLWLMSDLHIGANHVDYRLIKKEIREAIRRNDRILINGDVFDAILPGDRKRFTPDVLHPRLQGRRNILNAAVDWALEILAPAAHLIDMIGVGNHDVSVEKYGNVDVVRLLVDRLQEISPKNHTIHYGGYGGFVEYQNLRKSWVMYYHHGSGGASPVTKGMIDFNRKDVWVLADLIWMGHKHNRWAGHTIRMEMGPTFRNVYHVMTGAYFKTYCGQGQGSLREHGRVSNYAADMGLAPQGMGGIRVVMGKKVYLEL